MIKSIPKSNISRRSFKVYKLFNATEGDYTALTATSSYDGENHSLYRSIQSKYYTDNGVINNFGTISNPSQFDLERQLPEKIYVLSLSQAKYGEQIKPDSVTLIDNAGIELRDNGFGKMTFPNPSYTITDLDLTNGSITLVVDSVTYELDLRPTSYAIDIEAGELWVYDEEESQYEMYTIISYDLENEVLILSDPLDIEGTDLAEISYGNIFYSDGLIVFTSTNDVDLTTYSLSYRSTQTIHETEVLVESKAGEFNFSQNPSAVDVVLSGSYDFETTAITNVSPVKNVKIKEVQDIKLKSAITSSYDGLTNGSWDDYANYRMTDPTGSYLAPYITTIGIYDNDGDMVAVAKLPTPIKNLPDYDMNFIVRFDT